MSDFFIVQIDPWSCDLYGPYPTAELAYVDEKRLAKALGSLGDTGNRKTQVVEASHPRDLAYRLTAYWDGLDE